MVDILELSKSSASIKIKHFSRVSNMAAYFLVKFYFNFDVNAEFFNSFSDWLGD